MIDPVIMESWSGWGWLYVSGVEGRGGIGSRMGMVWKWGRGVAGCWISSGKKGVHCGESTKRSGKKTVNTSVMRLLPSLFGADLCPIASSWEEKWELKPGTHISGGVCVCDAPASRVGAELQVFVATCVLGKPWLLWETAECEVSSTYLLAVVPNLSLCNKFPFFSQKWRAVVCETLCSCNACVVFLSLVFSLNCMPSWEGKETLLVSWLVI